ncbi:MAG: hypothetical protein GXO25_03175 [Euryarchaeota archaeon]|nr:hypothetical protein [Euryarchaeota archaeon]
MREAFLAMILVMALLLVPLTSVHAAGDVNKETSPYPTITLYFSDGHRAAITGKVWAGTVFPVVEGLIPQYNWADKIKYLFFDQSLKGLNPYGLAFVRAMEKHPYSEFENNFYRLIGQALAETNDTDSDGDGYTNQAELEAGTYPGNPNSYPKSNEEQFWEEYQGYIVLISIIASIFVLYFVFNREKD